MRIAVCEDEEKYRTQVKGEIERIYHSLDVIVDTYGNGQELLERFIKKPYDIVFLDIEMSSMDGISLAKRIRKTDGEVILVFLTAHIEYALKGYEVNALRYLTKPLEPEKLKEVLCYVLERERERRVLWLRTQDGEERVSVREISYLEAQNQNIIIYTKKCNYTVRYNIGDYERELKEDGFFRIHRSYLVALGKVKGFRKREVLLEGDISLPVSRTREKALKLALYEYVKEEAF